MQFNIDWLNIAIPPLRILLILLVAWGTLISIRRIIPLLQEYFSKKSTNLEGVKRIETLLHVCRYVASVLVTLIGVLVILSEIGISIAPILGAAGVVGVAVGLGAQSLVKDYCIGLLFLLENQIRCGDSVELAGKTGIVEQITLRYVCLRDKEDDIHFISNSNITIVTNKSLGHVI